MSLKIIRRHGWRIPAALTIAAMWTLAAVGASAAAPTTGPLLSVVAGDGNSSIVPGGPALQSGVYEPQSVAADNHGGYYVTSPYQDVVLKVDASGTLTILAGKLRDGGTPTPGPAADSRLESPQSVASDLAGNAYIADSQAGEVLKVDTSGQLSVFAGNGVSNSSAAVQPGPALETSIYPQHVSVGPDGAVYVSTERQVVMIKDGQVTLIAGTNTDGVPTIGSAATASPFGTISGIAADAAGNVYIADAKYGCVVRVAAGTGELAPVVGTCGRSGAPVTGPAAASPINRPGELSVDRFGSLYIPDSVSRLILKVTDPASPAAQLSVLAGTGRSGRLPVGSLPTGPLPATTVDLNSPRGVSVSQDMSVYIVDYNWEAVADLAGIPSVPDAPTNLQVTPGQQTATFAFDEPADNGGSAITGYEYSADNGLTWQPLTITPGIRPVAVVSGLTDGTHYTFLVRAVNSAGPSATTAAEAVTPDPIPPVVLQAPNVIGDRAVGHPLRCASVEFADAATQRYQWSRDGITIAGGTESEYTATIADEGHDLACTVTATDASGTAHTTSTSVVIPIAAPSACPAPSGALTGTRLGPLALGETQSKVRAALPRFDIYSYHTDNFCLAQGQGIRVGYASARLLPSTVSSALYSKVVLALTANSFYSLDSVRPGERVAAVVHRLKLRERFHFGRNDWYTIPGRQADGVLKVRSGVILEVGIINRQLTQRRSIEEQLLRQF